MAIFPEIPPEQLASIQPIVEETIAVLRRAVARMPVDTPPALEYRPVEEDQ